MKIPYSNVQLADEYNGHRGQYYASPKLHGARALAFRNDEGKWELYSRAGNRWEAMFHIEIELEVTYADMDISFLDGELYNHEMDFEEIQSATRSVRVRHPRADEIQYFIWWAGKREDFFERKVIATEVGLARLRELEAHVVDSTPKSLDFVPYVMVDLPTDAIRIRKIFLSHGYEGAVYRHKDLGYAYGRNQYLLKDKPFTEQDFICVGFEEGKNSNEGSLGAIIVELENGKQSKVGTGFKQKMRKEVWANRDYFLGKKAEVRYGKISRYGKLIEPSFRGWKLDR